MAAGNFTASTINRLNVELGTMFANGNITQSQLTQRAITAKALLENQTAQVDERLEGGKCVGVKAWYLRGVSTAVTATDCTTPGGVEAETMSKNYDSAVIAQFAATAKDNRCDNEISFIQESTYQINNLVASLRKALNVYAVTKLAANTGAAASSWTSKPSTWDSVTHTPKIDVPKAEMVWDKLVHFKNALEGNGMGEYFMITGGANFNEEFWKAMYKKDAMCCDSGAYAAFQNFNMYFDSRDLDPTATGLNTFGVDRNSYVFWNSTFSSFTPTMIDQGATGEKWAWVIADPELVYMKDGRLVPVLYEVELAKSCTSRNTMSQLVYTYKYYVRVIGGLEFSPAGPLGETGVLRFSAI